ncbi:MAG: hypothetical protein AAF480_12985 [Actinomycetota bacterium]
MSERDEEIERIARDALRARAQQVEPGADAFARLADKVAGAARRPTPWWQSPRLLWLGAAGAAAAVVAIALVATVSGDDGEDQSAVSTETPTPVVEPTPDAVGSPTPDAAEPPATVTPTPSPTLHPTTTPTPVGGQGNVGRPDGVIWPVEAVQPFGEWPMSAEDAAQQFVQALGGWLLPVGEARMLDPILMIADVELQFTDEAGDPFGTSTTVRVVGGFDEAGVPNWGAVWARSDFIEVDRVFYDGTDFLVSGTGQAFEGVIETRLVDPSGNVAGQGFFTGGGVEMAPIEGTVALTESWPGPGFALLYDLGGLGITPTSLTVVPVVLPELDEPDPGAGSCSAETLEAPTPDPDLPEAVEATRQAIAGAAIACDWAALDALIDPSLFSFSFGADSDAVTFWQEVEGDFGGEPMRFLVETLKLNWILDDQTGATPVNWYIWPDAFPMIWEDVTPEMREALRPLYDDQDFEGFANIGGFAGYRLAITDTGNWLYFIAGD